MAVVSVNNAQCISQRFDCGSDMVELYRLDFWRADVVTTLNFSKFVDAVQSVRHFTMFCQCV